MPKIDDCDCRDCRTALIWFFAAWAFISLLMCFAGWRDSDRISRIERQLAERRVEYPIYFPAGRHHGPRQ